MFKLLRYFSVVSLVAIVVAAALLGTAYYRTALTGLIDMGENNNVALTRVLSNSLWPQFGGHIGSVGELSDEALKTHPETARLREAVLEQTRGLSIVKVKIYNLQGRTIFSSEAKQIGEDKSDNAGFVAARDGHPASELAHRDSFSAFEQTIVNRDLLSSYIPVRRSPGDPVEAVFEVYDDVTPQMKHIASTERQVILIVVAVMGGLYALLFLIVRRAERLIGDQAEQLRQSVEALHASRDSLEARVRERTEELASANHGLQAEIAERKRAEKEMNVARNAAEAAHRAKSQFLANMSHEIRTPMIGVLGMTELLLETPLTQQQRGFAETVQRSGNALLDIINDLLDFSSIDAGQLALEVTDFELPQLLSDLHNRLYPRAKAKGLNCVIDVDPDLPTQLAGDAERLNQILTNLVDNAIKFTHAGQVTVEVRRDLVSQDKAHRSPGAPASHWLRFSVTDTGIGMSAADRTRLFQPFTQGDDSTTRAHGGTGLGLAICRQLVDMMGGEIGVDSSPGQGSCFWFTLGFQGAAEGAVQSKANSAKAVQVAKFDCRLLLAEDNPVNQVVGRNMLQALVTAVDVVGDGVQAVQAIKAAAPGHYDLVLMDCHMPNMDGYEATAAIRAWEASRPDAPHLLIVAHTANTLKGNRQACLAAGMDDYLPKPYDLGHLAAMMARLLPEASHLDNEQAVPGDVQPAPRTLNREVLAGLRKLDRSGRPSVVDHIIGLYLDDAQRLLQRLDELTAEGDAEAVGERAHELKSSSVNVGAVDMSELSHRLQRCGQTGDLSQAPELLKAMQASFDALKPLLQAELGRSMVSA